MPENSNFDFENLTFDTVRNKWLSEGAKWFMKKEKPENWDLEEQLKNLQLPEAQKAINEMTKKYTEVLGYFENAKTIAAKQGTADEVPPQSGK